MMLKGMREWVQVMLAPDDGIPDLSGFQDDSAELPEIITLRPGEEIPDEEEDLSKVTLSRDEYEALKSGRDSNSALLEGFKGLQDTLAKPQQPVNIQQKPGESDDDFETRLEKELWKEGGSAKAIREAVQRYGNTQQLSQLMGVISLQNKQIMELHPEKSKFFNKYKVELEELVQNLPVEQQTHPQVWDYALKQIKEKHQDDIVSETVEEQVAQRVREELAKLGIGDEQEGHREGQVRSSYIESGRSPARTANKKKVFVTANEEREAAVSGLPIEEYLRKIGKTR